MWRFIIKVLLLGALILGLAHILPGLNVPNFPDALLFSCVLALLNAVITPILIVVSFPITVMTIGVFALLINIFMFWVASLISYGVYITSFWGAFWGGLIVTITSFILNQWLSDRRPRRPPPQDRDL